MEGEEIPDFSLARQGVHDGQLGAAGIPENILDPFLF
jgi:hypothetical protein